MQNLKTILLIPVILGILLVPFGLLIEKNLLTLFLFWFLLVPIVVMLVPSIIPNQRNQLLSCIAGVLLFYGFMIFMIYDHYLTDYFQIMMVSCAVNLALITAIAFLKSPSAQPR